MEIIRKYKDWNQALLKYFFTEKKRSPILYLDDEIVKAIAEENKLDSADFPRCCLLDQEGVNSFSNSWRGQFGEINHNIDNWSDLVDRLIRKKFIRDDGFKKEETPAYFGMIGALMYISCKVGADHRSIKNKAQEYLKNESIREIGEKIDPLFNQLARDYSNFDSDKMLGSARHPHINRIKYHIVLKPSDRERFLGFINANKLFWEKDGEDYYDYINYRLVPALEKAEDTNLKSLTQFFKDERENWWKEPFFKDLLQRDTFSYDYSIKHYKIPVLSKQLYWKYELYYDYDNETWKVNLISDVASDPLYSLFYNKKFQIVEKVFRDYVGEEIPFKEGMDLFFSQKTLYYDKPQNIEEIFEIHNIGSGDVVILRKEGDFYIQTRGIETIGNYFIITKKEGQKKVIISLSSGNNKINKIREEDLKEVNINETNEFSAFKILITPEMMCHKTGKIVRKKKDKRYKLEGVGSWNRINLEEGDKILWKSFKMRDKEKHPQKLAFMIGKDDKYYFRIPKDDLQDKNIYGRFCIVRDDKIQHAENIRIELKWDGLSQKYHLDRWGNLKEGEDKLKINKAERRQSIQNEEEVLYSSSREKGSDMLLQIFHDLADENGCVPPAKFNYAIKFVFEFFDIPIQNLKNVTQALILMGYLIQERNPGKGWINQLVKPFIEKTNYTKDYHNLYLIKGAYDIDIINKIKDKNLKLLFKPPFNSNFKLSFHSVLPDLILMEDYFKESTYIPENWQVFNGPIGLGLIDIMESVNNFYDTFIRNNPINSPNMGVQCKNPPAEWRNENNLSSLCIEDEKGEQWLYTKYYNSQDLVMLIPREWIKAYCQMQKNLSGAVLKSINGNVEAYQGYIGFTRGMAMPILLEMAYCDLQLELPAPQRVFICNVKERNLPPDTWNRLNGEPIYYNTSYLVSFPTHIVKKAAGHNLDMVLEKLSGNKERYFLWKRDVRKLTGYKMYYIKNEDGGVKIVLTKEDKIVAFYENHEIFLKPKGKEYLLKVIWNGSMNEIFSKILYGNEKELQMDPRPQENFSFLSHIELRKENEISIIP